MISQARCRGDCNRVTPHHICWGGDGVYFTCTVCGEQFKPTPEPEQAPAAIPDADVWKWTCHRCGYFVESVVESEMRTLRAEHLREEHTAEGGR